MKMLDQREEKGIIEKRRYPRIDTSNTVYYSLYNEKNIKIGHGKGQIINISQAGTLLKTNTEIKGAFIVLQAKDLDGNKLQINGKLITSRNCIKTINYLTGIEFFGPKEKLIKAIMALVKIYQKNKHKAENQLTILIERLMKQNLVAG